MPRSTQPETQVPSRRPPPALTALVGAGAASLLIVMVPEFEGVVLKGYRDPIGIPTKCMGDTSNVVMGRRYSEAECKASLERQLIAHAAPVLACTPRLRGRTYELAAAVDLAYNIGAGAWCRSSADRKFDAGDFAGGCRALGLYVKAGGRVLPGLVRRRRAEVALCLKGAGR